MEADCAALDGSCAVGREKDCVIPLTDNCVEDLVCPDVADDASMSGWGRCWDADSNCGVEGAIGRRYRGRNLETVTQSVCTGGPPLLEHEACGPPALTPPCTS